MVVRAQTVFMHIYSSLIIIIIIMNYVHIDTLCGRRVSRRRQKCGMFWRRGIININIKKNFIIVVVRGFGFVFLLLLLLFRTRQTTTVRVEKTGSCIPVANNIDSQPGDDGGTSLLIFSRIKNVGQTAHDMVNNTYTC